MTDRQVWITAGEIVAEHGEMTADYLFDRFNGSLCDPVAAEDWRRIVAAVDAISSVGPRC